MNEAQVTLDTVEVEGVSGGGLVKIRATAKGRILGLSIDDSLIVPEDKAMLEDLVTAAFNDAPGEGRPGGELSHGQGDIGSADSARLQNPF